MALIDLKNFKSNLLADIAGIPPSLVPSYYPFLDGLRAFSIISVLAGHFLRDSRWLPFVDGAVGVYMFFLISGFLITTILLKEKVKFGKVSYKNFYARRALRILPVAYLFLLVLLMINPLFNLGVTTNQFLASAFYVKNLQVQTDWSSAHFWSLSIEEQFYLLMPIVLISNTNRYVAIVCVLLIITPILSFLGFHNVGVFYTNKPLHLITVGTLAVLDRGAVYLLTGSLLSILIFKQIIRPDGFRGSRFLSLLLFLAALTIHYLQIPYLSAICFAVLMSLVLVLNIGQENRLTQILSTRVLVKIGILSYSIYVWQQLFTVYQPWAKAFPYAGTVLFNLPLLLIVSWASYTFYERYFLKLKGRFAKVTDAENTGRHL